MEESNFSNFQITTTIYHVHYLHSPAPQSPLRSTGLHNIVPLLEILDYQAVTPARRVVPADLTHRTVASSIQVFFFSFFLSFCMNGLYFLSFFYFNSCSCLKNAETYKLGVANKHGKCCLTHNSAIVVLLPK